ncbi:MAG: hypothetical protein WBF90_33670 [Rivularia sp. (in: cyanobacteria)]
MMNQQRAIQLLNTHLGRSLAGAAASGGGAVVYNQFTEDDINPLLAAGVGGAAGYGSKVIQNKMMSQPQITQPQQQEAFLLPPSDRRVNNTQLINNQEVITPPVSVSNNDLEKYDTKFLTYYYGGVKPSEADFTDRATRLFHKNELNLISDEMESIKRSMARYREANSTPQPQAIQPQATPSPQRLLPPFNKERHYESRRINPISRNAAEFDARFDSDAAWDNGAASVNTVAQIDNLMPPTVQIADNGLPIIPGYPNGYNPYG